MYKAKLNILGRLLAFTNWQKVYIVPSFSQQSFGKSRHYGFLLRYVFVYVCDLCFDTVNV